MTDQTNNVVKYLTVAAENRTFRAAPDELLDFIADVRAYLDRWERLICEARMHRYDDWGAAS